MTLSKETLEAATPAAKSPAQSAASPKSDVNRTRADAVSLDVPVKVHGSRVTEVARGATPQTEPFEEETSTMIVFPQGGVLRMATTVSVGQMLVVTNLRTKQDAICRVLKVRAYSNTQAYVEVEFTHRQAGYWGVHFPADDDDSTAASAPAETTERKKADMPAIAPVSMKVEKLASPPPPPSQRKESAFAPIGSREDVQLAATVTEAKPRPAPVPPQQAAPVRPPAPVAPAPVAAAPVLPEEPLTEPEAHEAEEEPKSSRSFGTFGGGSSLAISSSRVPDFGASLESETRSQAAPAGGNWKWIAACAGFLVVGLAGGAMYFRSHSPAAPPQVPAQSVETARPQQMAAPVTAPTSGGTSGEPGQTVSAVPASPAELPAATPAESNAAVERPTRSAPVAENTFAKPPAAAEREGRTAPARSIDPGAMNARPMVKRSVGNVDAAAPTIGLAPLSLPGALAPAPELAPPAAPLERVRVGGKIVQPKLVHSVPPIYPSEAQRGGISGDVVIDGEVDKTGNVAAMRVISGPSALQQAALNAMRQWKYQAGTLDGVPAVTHVTVTIRFQAQR